MFSLLLLVKREPGGEIRNAMKRIRGRRKRASPTEVSFGGVILIALTGIQRISKREQMR